MKNIQIVGFRVEPMSIKHSWEGDAEYVQGQTVLKTCNDQIVPSNDAKNYQSGTMRVTSKFEKDLCLERIFIISYLPFFTPLFTLARLIPCLLFTSHFTHSFLTLPPFLFHSRQSGDTAVLL